MKRASLWVSRLPIWGIALALAAGGWGCATGGTRATGDRFVERSARQRPGWITQLPQEEGYFFATGIATGAASLEEGKAAGVQAAVQDVVTYLGIRAQVYYKETRTELTTRLVNRITSEGFAQVAKGRPVEMYYERFLFPGTEKSGSGYRWDVYVLLRIPQGVLNEEEERLKLDRQRRLDLAARLLKEGRTYSEAGDAGGAVRRWLEAGRLLEGEGGVDALRHEVKEALSELAGVVSLVSGGKERTPRGEEGSWTVRAVMRQGAKETRLRWLPLKVRFQAGSATIVEPATTDDQGEARVALPPHLGDPSRVGVAVGIDMDRLLSVGGNRTPPREDLLAGLQGLEAAVVWLHRPEPVLQTSTGAPSPNGVLSPPAVRANRPAEPEAAEAGASRSENLLSTEPPAEPRPLRVRIEPVNTLVYMTRGGREAEVGYLVDIRAPAAPSSTSRRPLNLALVVDSSGSMADAGKLDYVKEAVRLVMRNLGPQDRLSFVVYSDEARALVSGGTASDRLPIEHHLNMLQAMGSTNLSGGLFEGVNQVESFFLEEGINRVILLSDGLANRGVVSRPELERYAAKAGDKGVSLSTIGVGRDFNEELMMAIASAGRGNYYYVGDPETVPSVFMKEMEGLASVAAQNITLTLSLNRGVEVAEVLGLPYEKAEGKVRIRLGDMASGGRSLAGFTLRLVQEPEREGLLEMGSLSVGYNSVAGEIGRVKDLVPLRIEFTRERSRVEAGVNRRVDRYLQLLAAADVMTLAMKSGDPDAAQEATRWIESEMESFLQWTRTVDDPEVASLGSIFKDCLAEMRKGMAYPGSGMALSNRDAGKEIRYKLYRLRRQMGR